MKRKIFQKLKKLGYNEASRKAETGKAHDDAGSG